MTLPTLTLADFLLARIAEDEAAASLEVGRRDVILTGAFAPAFILAECEAKRRIVVRCQEILSAAVPMAVHLAQQTLADMCRPYTDHPDYRDEWRP